MTDILADTSAWMASRRDLTLWEAFRRVINADSVLTCDMVKLEVLYSTRTASEFDETRIELDTLRQCPIGVREWTRAIDVSQALAHAGGLHHRSVGDKDLLIAAAAESAGVTILHYDEGFDRIAAVTGQPAEWIAPRGSL